MFCQFSGGARESKSETWANYLPWVSVPLTKISVHYTVLAIYCDPKIKAKNCKTYVLHGFCRACLEVPLVIKAVTDIRFVSLCLVQLLPKLRTCTAWQSLETKISLVMRTSCRRLKGHRSYSCFTWCLLMGKGSSFQTLTWCKSASLMWVEL